MRGRWLIGSGFFCAAIMAAGLVRAQEGGRSRSLIDRFNDLRRGWTQQLSEPDRSEPEPSPPRAPNPLDLLFPGRGNDSPAPMPTGPEVASPVATGPQPAAESDPSRFPQVNPRDLLPLDLFRGDSSAHASEQPSPGPPPRMGSVSRSLGSSRQVPAYSPSASGARPSPDADRLPTAPGTDFPVVSHGAGDFGAQSDAVDGSEDSTMIIATDRAQPPSANALSERDETVGAGPISEPLPLPSPSNSSANTAESGASARRSPQSGTRYAFNPDELRRDRSSGAESENGNDSGSISPDGTYPAGAATVPPAPIGSSGLSPSSDGGDSEPSAVLQSEQGFLHVPAESESQTFSISPSARAAEPPSRAEVDEGRWSSTQAEPKPPAPEESSQLGNARRAFSNLENAADSARQLTDTLGSSARPARENDSAEQFGPFDSASGTSGSLRGPADGASLGSASSGQLLATQQTPLVSSKVTGPKHILIGRVATYRIDLKNGGEHPANEVVAEIDVPDWAEIADTSVSTGIVQRPMESGRPNALRWQISRLDAQSVEYLDLNLIPHDSRPLELGVLWRHTPVEARAIVEVQEPKLRMHVAGPEEVLFGEPQYYRLVLSNPGTGTAEEVRITLMPPGGGGTAVSSHQIGSLAPGETKSIDVELTPRDAGKLTVLASATAAGGLTAEASKEVFCRKPELEVDWRGPESKYAGTEATYYFRVRNPGTAPAEEVEVSVGLPVGMEFVSASQGESFDVRRREVRWQVGTLRPGDDFYMELKSVANTPGDNRLVVTAATADRQLKDNTLARTNVVALADLKLEVGDPRGPVPIGEEVVYDIRVRNRGQNTAQNVNIVALFSEGIEPHSADGAQYNIADGRVAFRTIENIPADREIALRVRARALKPGTHVFRAEVLCRDLDIKLAAEETTRFYQDDVIGAEQSSSLYEGSEAAQIDRMEQFR